MAATVPVWAAVLAAAFLSQSMRAHAGPINSDEALTPNAGGLILRLKGVYANGGASGTANDVDAFKLISTAAYGVRDDLAIVLRAPVAYRRLRSPATAGGGSRTQERIGPEDFTLFMKYRFWRSDTSPINTYRWAVVGGLDIRTGDDDFSSDSYDPLTGVAMSLRRNRHHVAGDLVYQLNTGSGPFGNDALRYDVAYSYRVYPKKFVPGNAFQWDIVSELNGRYLTDGSHELYFAPGLQYAAQRWMFETSFQLPVAQDLTAARFEADYRVVAGVRLRF